MKSLTSIRHLGGQALQISDKKVHRSVVVGYILHVSAAVVNPGRVRKDVSRKRRHNIPCNIDGICTFPSTRRLSTTNEAGTQVVVRMQLGMSEPSKAEKQYSVLYLERGSCKVETTETH